MPQTKTERTEYMHIKIPEELVVEVDNFIADGQFGYRSRTEFVKDAVRRLLSEYGRKEERTEEEMLDLKHFNLNEDGVLVLDRVIQPDNLIQVYFRPEGVYCELCESMKCRHVEFALRLPKVQDILHKKGWKIKILPP